MARKKIVFIIVEGPSDEEALSVLFERYYKQNNENVHIEVIHGDITTQRNVNETNIREKITDLVKKHAGTIYKNTDYAQIIHLIDMDGAYIPDDNITENAENYKVIYTSSEIKCPNKENIIKRNLKKSRVIDSMTELKKIWRIVPYNVYYMSCNLDHVLYNIQNGTDKEKEDYSLMFVKKYKDNIPSFVSFISESEFSVTGSYNETWEFIKKDLNSLNRYSNLGISFLN